MNKNKGITLIALVITIIVLIILAGVSINLILGQYGIVNRATSGAETYSEKQAKEKLELELSNMYIEKSTNINYNENDYLTTKLSEKGFSVNGNIVIVDGYQFQIDRTVPKIMNSLGKGIENNEIILTANSNLEVDYTKSTIKIEITYAGTLKEVNLNGESLTIPEAQDGKYVIEKEVEKNGNYNVFVKDSSDGYKIANVEVKDISEDIEINNEEALVKLAERVNAGATYEGRTVTLTRNLDLSSVCGADKGKNWTPIGTETNPFMGIFDGDNNIINNIYINNSESNQGLFGIIGSSGTVRNVTLNGSMNSLNIQGGISGINYGIIENCVNNVNLKTSSYVCGGIVGRNYGIIYKSINNGQVISLDQSAGGIAAENGCNDSVGFIFECINNGNIDASSWVSGGITAVNGNFGNNSRGYVVNCYNTGTISGGQDRRGGIVGQVKCKGGISYVYNCYNRGNIGGCPEIIGFDWGGETSYVTLNSYGSADATIEKLNVRSEITEELQNIGLYKNGVWTMKNNLITLDFE